MADLSGSNGARPEASGSSAIEHAFARLPRPQKVLDVNLPIVPTKASLLQARTREKLPQRAIAPPPQPPPRSPPVQDATSATPPPASWAEPEHRSPDELSGNDLFRQLGPMVTLGKFAQDGVEWAVRAQRGRSGLIMVKKLERPAGLAEKRILDQISHRNVAKVVHTFAEDDSLCLALEYCRFTLAEVLHVHLKLEEQHIQHIAHSVFNALSYLGTRGITHHCVKAQSVRITVPEMRIVLSNFELATKGEPSLYPNHDLFDLGIVLLECMDGHSLSSEKRNIHFIRSQRAMNKVFGLKNAERWSGCKQLIDFLDDLFNEERHATIKIARPHRFVSSKREDYECMRPYVELVTFECFALWVAGD